MGAPNELKDLNAYVAGFGYKGKVASFEEPVLAMETEEILYGGMLGAVEADRGLKAMQAVITMGSQETGLAREFGTASLTGTQIRLVGAYRADATSAPVSVEIYIGGRFKEINFGTAERKKGVEHKYTCAVAYYRRVVNGADEIEIDMINGIFIVGGVDRYADIMAIIDG